MDIVLMNIVQGTSTNTEGCKLFYSMKDAISQSIEVRLSLKGATPMSSSFLNSSFGELTEIFGIDKVKKLVKLTNIKPSHAQQIKNYLIDISMYSK